MNLNITIILSLYSAIELYLLEIKDKYKFENKLLLNSARIEIKKLDSKVIQLINHGTVEDFETNTGEIAHEFDKLLYVHELKAYYSFQLIKKLHKDINYSILKSDYVDLTSILIKIDYTLERLFDNIILPKDKKLDLNIFETKIKQIFKWKNL